MHHQAVSIIQSKLSWKEELKENEKKSLLNEQLDKSTLKLDNIKKLIKVQQKVDNYTNFSAIASFMYLPNKINLHKINNLIIESNILEKTIVNSKQDIENIIFLKSSIKESTNIINSELDLAISNLPTF